MVIRLYNSKYVGSVGEIHHPSIISISGIRSFKPKTVHKPVKSHSANLIIHDPTDLSLLGHQHHRVLGGVNFRPAGGCPGFALCEDITHRYGFIVILDSYTSVIIQPHPFHELKKRPIGIIIDNINSLIKLILINLIAIVSLIHKIIISLYSFFDLILIKTIDIHIYNIINSVLDIIINIIMDLQSIYYRSSLIDP